MTECNFYLNQVSVFLSDCDMLFLAFGDLGDGDL